MSSGHFTPKELFDILLRELQPNEQDLTTIFQMVGLRALQHGKFWVTRLSPRNSHLFQDMVSGEYRFTIKETDVTLSPKNCSYNAEQQGLLSVLGVTLFEKDDFVLMLSDTRVSAFYSNQHVNREKQQYDMIVLKYSQGWVSLSTTDSIAEMFNTLTTVLGVNEVQKLLRISTFTDLQKKIEAAMVHSACCALSATRAQDESITECLPVMVLYQILKSD